MILKVNHEELANVSDTMKSDKELFDTEIDNIVSNIDILKNVWKGEDSDNFCENLLEFTNKMRTISDALETLSNTCETANTGYKTIDTEVSEELKREAVTDESSSNN